MILTELLHGQGRRLSRLGKGERCKRPCVKSGQDRAFHINATIRAVRIGVKRILNLLPTVWNWRAL